MPIVAAQLVRSLRRTAFILAFALLIPWTIFFSLVQWLPYPSGLEQPGGSSTQVEDRDGRPLAAFASADGQWRLPLAENQITPHLLQAIVAVEDARFFKHRGVDWTSAAAASWEDISTLRFRRGASTLSMQVQRLRDPGRRTLLNKLQQAVRAEQIERRQSKQQTLVEYANRAPFGGNLIGAGAASWRYFGKPCAQLSLGEAALLAGLPQSPNRLRPDRFPALAIARRNHVLDRMVANHSITLAQRNEACREPLNVSWRSLPQDSLSADGSLPTLLWLAHRHPNGVVRATLDATVQRQASAATSEHLRSLESSGITAAAVVVLDTASSECLASLSLGCQDLSIDLTRCPRSTGSTLKPFIYAAAFDGGIYGPRSVLSDSPAAWPGYEPNDYDRGFRGRLSAAEALAESRNIPAMLVLAKVGVEPAAGVMDAAGLHRLAREPGRYGLSLAVGGAEATPMEIAEAYAALGRGGECKPVRSIASSQVNEGSFARCVRPAACWQVLEALSAADRTARVCPEASQSHVAWKTGTSSGHRDAWCAAVTRRRTVVVWLGNAGGEASPSLIGQEAAAPLALRLIAALDPVEEPWPVVAPGPALADRARRDDNAGELVMASPAPGQQFVVTSDDPRSKQRVLLRAMRHGAGAGNDQFWWFVDDQPVGAVNASRRLWWPPTPGQHEVRVIDALGHSASTHIAVKTSP